MFPSENIDAIRNEKRTNKNQNNKRIIVRDSKVKLLNCLLKDAKENNEIEHSTAWNDDPSNNRDNGMDNTMDFHKKTPLEFKRSHTSIYFKNNFYNNRRSDMDVD